MSGGPSLERPGGEDHPVKTFCSSQGSSFETPGNTVGTTGDRWKELPFGYFGFGSYGGTFVRKVDKKSDGNIYHFLMEYFPIVTRTLSEWSRVVSLDVEASEQGTTPLLSRRYESRKGLPQDVGRLTYPGR